VTPARAVRRTRDTGVTGVAVKHTTAPCVVLGVTSATINVSATTTVSLSVEVSAPTTFVLFIDFSQL